MKLIGMALFVITSALATFLFVTDPTPPPQPDPDPVVDPDKTKTDPDSDFDPKNPFGVSDLDTNFTFPSTVAGGTFGIDVSHYQKDINWAEVAKSGVSFAFIKALEGTTELDKKFQANWQGAQKNGILFAPYHFMSPLSKIEDQTARFLSIEGVTSGTLPIVLDVEAFTDTKNKEIDLWASKSAAEIVAMITYFAETVEKQTNHPVMIYSVKSWWDKSIGSAGGKVISSRDIWIADPSSNALKSGIPSAMEGKTPAYWQFTEKGKVPGITGEVDVSVKRK